MFILDTITSLFRLILNFITEIYVNGAKVVGLKLASRVVNTFTAYRTDFRYYFSLLLNIFKK